MLFLVKIHIIFITLGFSGISNLKLRVSDGAEITKVRPKVDFCVFHLMKRGTRRYCFLLEAARNTKAEVSRAFYYLNESNAFAGAAIVV